MTKYLIIFLKFYNIKLNMLAIGQVVFILY